MRTIFRNNYTPVMGEYHERYVIDEARHKSYLFDCDGVFNELPYVYVANEKGQSEEYAVSQKLFTDEVTKLADDIDYEAAARAATDIELGEAIDKETSDREDADTDLQNQIDLIKAASDVVDVVGTYADLQAYDTTKLNNNDIVKVLDDETRDDGITYYRWSTSTQTFTFVGALSAYYSKDETDTLLAGKQDTLTAGANIQINDNVISATDTTYTAGDNVSIDTNNVISATDTTYTAGTGISITGDVISSTIKGVTVVYGDQVEHGGFVYLQFYLDSAKTDLITIDEMVDLLEAGSVIINTPLVDSTTKNFYVVAYQTKETASGTVLYFYTTEGAAISRYYTWSDADQFDGAKQHLYWLQNKLSAGSNISIQGDTISATDTTYSSFVGTDGTAAGTAGLVPAPATTDADKYLKADGTWDTISIPSVTLYSGTGQNTDGAMTQKAVTDTLFESNDTTRIKIGSGAVNGGAASVVIGSQGVQALTPNSIAIGNGGTTAGSSEGTGFNVAIGSYGVVATGDQSVAIGVQGAQATAQGATAIGIGMLASGVDSLAIGRGGRAAHKDSVALGAGAITGRDSEVSIGGRNGSSDTKYIANVTAGVNPTDAVNVYQLNIGLLYKQDRLTAGTGISIDANNVISSTSTNTLYSTTGQNTDGAMTQKAVTDTIFENNDTKRIKIGNGATTSNSSSIAIGESATASGTNALAIGPKEDQWNNTARATGAYSISMGTGQAKQNYAIAIGHGVVADRPSSIAIGASNSVFAGSGVAIGSSIIVSGSGTIGIGNNARVDGSRSIAIGNQAKAGEGINVYTDSIALGSYSTSGRDSELSIGTPADSSNAEKTRYIAHVTAGVNDTDAVNKKQLDDAIAAVPSANNINSTDWDGLWQ